MEVSKVAAIVFQPASPRWIFSKLCISFHDKYASSNYGKQDVQYELLTSDNFGNPG